MSPSLRRQLYEARELLELRFLVAALDAVSLALRLEYPTVDTLPKRTDPPTLRSARRLLLRAYRRAVRRVIALPDEQLPF
jgi:hypothetical protein